MFLVSVKPGHKGVFRTRFTTAQALTPKEHMTRPDSITPVQDIDLLDTGQLATLEHAFLAWAAQAEGGPRLASRRRVVCIFLLIRYTGAKLSETLALVPQQDIDVAGRTVTFAQQGQAPRVAHLSQKIASRLASLLPQAASAAAQERSLDIDPAFVRRKFYERAEACGFTKKQGGPEMIRKARALELMRNNMPLPVVQRLMGHATPNQTSAFVSFSEKDMQSVARLYMEREGAGKSSARNTFYGKVRRVVPGGVQSLVEMATTDAQGLVTLVTNTSAARLELVPGKLVSAEVKAPWLLLERCDTAACTSADNMREGVLYRVTHDALTAECLVRLQDETELCAIVSSESFARLRLAEGDAVRVLFSAHAVILHAQQTAS